MPPSPPDTTVDFCPSCAAPLLGRHVFRCAVCGDYLCGNCLMMGAYGCPGAPSTPVESEPFTVPEAAADRKIRLDPPKPEVENE